MFHKTQSNKVQAKTKKKKPSRVAFVCFFWSYRATGSVNCTRADRVTSVKYRGHFRFILMLKKIRFCIKSIFFRRVTICANLGNIAMHSFCKIILFFPANYEFLVFWNSEIHRLIVLSFVEFAINIDPIHKWLHFKYSFVRIIWLFFFVHRARENILIFLIYRLWHAWASCKF